MRLNKSTSHALRILIDCARANGELVKVADVSARLDITMQNVFKIVHILSRAELISAVRGRNGGVRLGRPATQIRISDIVRAMESTEVELSVEGSGKGTGGRAVRDVNRVLDDALEAFIGVLDKHTLADMAGGTGAIARGKVAKAAKISNGTKAQQPAARRKRSPGRAARSRPAARSSGN